MKFSKVKNSAIQIFFALMLIVPASFQTIRGIFLVLILLFSLPRSVSADLRFNKSVIAVTLINVAASLFFFLNGVFHQTPGAFKVTSVFIIWPLLYCYFIGLHHKLSTFLSYNKTIFVAGVLTCLLVLVFIINELFHVSGVITALAKQQDFMAGFYSGFIELHSSNLTTVLYLFCFALTFLLLPKDLRPSNISHKLLLFTIIISGVLMLISGRRGFWVAALLCPAFVFVILLLCGIKPKFGSYFIRIAAAFVVVAILFSIFALDTVYVEKEFMSIFEFDDPNAYSNYQRTLQFKALINGWKQSPLIGQGLGAYAPDSIRDPVSPWAYELSYVALLFHTGIAGIVVYGGSVIWLYYKAIKVVKRNRAAAGILLPQLVALLCFLFVNASNPYLAKFDFLWVIFLPVTALHASLIEENQRRLVIADEG